MCVWHTQMSWSYVKIYCWFIPWFGHIAAHREQPCDSEYPDTHAVSAQARQQYMYATACINRCPTSLQALFVNGIMKHTRPVTLTWYSAWNVARKNAKNTERNEMTANAPWNFLSLCRHRFQFMSFVCLSGIVQGKYFLLTVRFAFGINEQP